MTVKVAPEASYDPAMFDFQEDLVIPEMSVTVRTDEIFYGGDHLTGTYIPGVYTVEVRAFTVNSIDTGYFQDLTVAIVDPCLTADLSFKNNEGLEPLPDTTLV